MKEFKLKEGESFIELYKLLKILRLVGTGGEAKMRISDGEVILNGETEFRKRCKLKPGDIVLFEDEEIHIKA